MIIIKNIIQILTDPKNTRMFLLGGIVVLFILLFRQCEQTNIAKGEAVKISNNWKASLDTIENYIDKPWHPRFIVLNPNLTIDFINNLLLIIFENFSF